jgi:hypothetical protein
MPVEIRFKIREQLPESQNDGLCGVRLETQDVFDLKRSDENSCVLACSVQAEELIDGIINTPSNA